MRATPYPRCGAPTRAGPPDASIGALSRSDVAVFSGREHGIRSATIGPQSASPNSLRVRELTHRDRQQSLKDTGQRDEVGQPRAVHPRHRDILPRILVLDRAGQVVAEKVVAEDVGHRVQPGAQEAADGAVDSGLGKRLANGYRGGVATRLDDPGGKLPRDAVCDVAATYEQYLRSVRDHGDGHLQHLGAKGVVVSKLNFLDAELLAQSADIEWTRAVIALFPPAVG